MKVESTLESVAGWSLEERLELAFLLWDQIVDGGFKAAPSQEVKAELDRRLQAFRAEPSRALTWEEVEAHVRRERP